MYGSTELSQIKNKDVLFFAQTFLELASYKTVESYKAKMMMSISLCEEYKMLYLHEFVKNEYLEIIIKELRKTLKQDIVAKKILYFSLDDYCKKGLCANKNIKQQYKIIKLLIEELSPIKYIDESIKFIEENINKKNEVRSVTSNLISLLNHLGINSAYLFYSAKVYFENNDINKNPIENFFERILFSLGKEYDVYIEIHSLPSFINKDFFKNNLPNVSVITKSEQKVLKQTGTFLTGNKSKVLLFKNISGKDPYSAISEAKFLIDKIDIVYNIFNHSDKIIKGKSNLAIDNKHKNKYYFDNTINPITHQQHFNYRTNQERFQTFFSNFMIHSQSIHKFDKALTLHSYALRNDKPENQLIFFWTALETIAVQQSKKSIIDSVISFMLPFLKKRYFHINFKYIYEQLIYHNKGYTENIFIKNNIELNYENFIKVVLFEDKIKNEIFKSLDKFPILRHRIFTIFNELNTPQRILKKLEIHEETIIEQIRRIYRYRNLVIHDAKGIEISNILLSNIHNYFDYILEEIIEHSYGKNISNIEELKLYIEMKVENNINLLKQEKNINEKNFLDLYLLKDYI